MTDGVLEEEGEVADEDILCLTFNVTQPGMKRHIASDLRES
jgi:hypothetical protein